LHRKTDDAVLESIQTSYQRVTRQRRQLRDDDRIVEDLSLDSLAMMELLVEIEDRFEVALFDAPQVQQVETVGDLVELIQTVREAA
jgi:acyl carrier protein